MFRTEHDIWERLSGEKRPIIIYGTGNGADKVINELERLSVRICGIMASDDFVRGQCFRGYTVKKLSELEKEFSEPIILIAFGTQRSDVIENILSIAKTHTVLCADVPVYGDNIFNKEYCSEHLDELDMVYDLLADEQSRKVFRSVIEFRITGQLEKLTSCFTEKREAYTEILKLGSRESYLDLGAYRGDTIEQFLHYTNGSYTHITALEPDRRTYMKLKQYGGAMRDTQLFNMGIWDSDTDLKFEASLGRGSSINDKGEQALSVTCIDTLYRRRTVSFIKIDVEGAEDKALSGGKAVLKRDKPKLDIAMYHRSEDIFKLPLMLHETEPSYKLYLRQHPHIPAWDLDLYAVV